MERQERKGFCPNVRCLIWNGQYMSSSQEIPRGLSAECSLAGKGRGRGRGRGLGRGQRVVSKECSPNNSPNAARRPAQTLYKPGAFRKLKTNNGGSTEETSNAVQSSLSNESREVKHSVEKSPIKTKPLRVEKGSSYNIDDLVDQFDVDKENADTRNSAYSCTIGHDVCLMDNSGSTDPVDGVTDSSGYPKTVTLQNADTCNSAYSGTTDHDVCTMDNSGSTDPVDGLTDNSGFAKAVSLQNADTCNSTYSCTSTTDHDVCLMYNSGPTDPVDGLTDNSGFAKAVALQNADTCNSAYSGTTDHDVCTMDNSGSTDPVDGLTDNSGFAKAVSLQNADTCNSTYSCTSTTDHDVCLMYNSGPTDPVDGLTDNSCFAKAVALQNVDTCHSGYSGTTDHDVCSTVNSGSTDPVNGVTDTSGYRKAVVFQNADTCNSGTTDHVYSMDNSGSTDPVDGLTYNSGYTIAVTLQNADTCNSAYSGTTDHEVCSMVNSGSTDPVDADNSEYSKAVDGLSDNSGSADLAVGHNENTGFTECVIGLTDKNRSTNYVGPIDNPDPVVGSTDNVSNVLGVDPTSNSSTHHSNSSTDHVVSSTDDRGSTNHGVVSTGKNNSADPAIGHRDNSGYTDSAVLGGTDNSGSFDHVVGVTDYNGFMHPVIACSDNSGCTDSAVDHVESLIELDKRNSEENKLIDHDMNKFHSSESGASGQDPDFEEMTHLNEAMNVKTPLKEEELKGREDLADKISTTCTDRKDLRTDVLQKVAGTSENIKDNYAAKHKSKRQCKKEEKAKKKEGKLKKKSKTPLKSDTNTLKKDVGDCLAVVEGKTETQCKRKEDRVNEKNEEIEKRDEKAKMGEEGSEADWETSWGENGECLNEEILAELNEIVDVPDVEIVRTQFDYLSFKPKDIVLDSGVFDHVAELYDFSPELKTPELIHALSKFKSQGFEIVWVDDTHALAVFSNHKMAQSAIEECSSPMLKLRPLYHGTQESKLKARRNVDSLQPYKERPKTSKLIANRLVTGALGVRSKMSKEERQLEREKIKAERERKLNKEKQKKDLWESEDLPN